MSEPGSARFSSRADAAEWMRAWCDTCKHDILFPDQICPILQKSYTEIPSEWRAGPGAAIKTSVLCDGYERI